MMSLRVLLAAGAGLSLLAAPLAAQNADAPMEAEMVDDAAPPSEADELAAMSEMFSGMFTAEPLTPEQEARLPAAAALIAKVIPAGTMGEMMDTMFESVLAPMMAMAPDGATTTLAKQTGLPAYAVSLDEEQANELASLFDPAWQERQKREVALFPALMKEVVVLMEPGMRKAMSEVYAIRFSSGELAEIDAFFSTGTGGKYAREAFLMASDPRIMASTMEAMPALMGKMGDIEARMAASVADLPAVRSFADLSPAERAKVAEMTGYSVEEIEANLAAADAALADADAAAADAAAE